MKPSELARILPCLPKGSEVLILRLRSLGDIVLLTPALAALHAWRPDLALVVLVEPRFASLLEGHPAVAEVLAFRGFGNAVRGLRRRRFPVVFNQHGGPTSALLAAAAGAPVRVCWSGCQFSFFYNALAPPAVEFFGPRKVHTVEHRMTQFYAAGLPRGPIPPARIYPQRDATASVAAILAQRGIAPGKPYAVLHPGGAYPTKRWSLEGFAEIARWLEAEHGVTPVVSLGPGDRTIAAAARRQCNDAAVVLEEHVLPLREMVALIAGARLFLGNDSGPAHVATATGRPAVVIFGSTDSATWRPWQTDHRIVQNDFPCNPCRGDRCYAFSTMTGPNLKLL